MNGTFNVALDTPIGTVNGVLVFIDEHGILSGSIRTMGITSYFKSGKINGNSFTFSGTLNTGFSNFEYTAKGTVSGNTIKAVAATGSATFQIHGTRVS